MAGGSFSTFSPNGGAAFTRNNIARVEVDGLLDLTLNLGVGGTGGGLVRAVAVQPDGKILIGGDFNTVLGVTRNNLARLNTDGTLDTVFNPNPNNFVNAMAVQPDGKILVAGAFTAISGQTRLYIARLDGGSGLVDSSFDPSANQSLVSITIQPDGKILVGGGFSVIGGQPRNFVARLDATNGFADSFNPNANGIVETIAVDVDGKVLLGGLFTTLAPNGGSTVARNYLARLNPTGTLDAAFDPNPNNIVDSIALQTDGKILVGGSFHGVNSIGGQARNFIARLDPATGLPDSYNPSSSGNVYTMAIQADGKILVGGLFSIIGGQARHAIARLDPGTGLADSFDPNVNAEVHSIGIQADGKILAGGFFTSVGGQSRSAFARLSNDTAALQNLTATQHSMTWARGGASPQFTRVSFQASADGVNYSTFFGGAPSGGNWTLGGLNFSTGRDVYIRARGFYNDGQSGSESIVESLRKVFLPTPGLVGNVATRLPVGTGDNVLIEGFTVQGPAGSTKKIIVRATGPSLATCCGITDALANPTLEIHDTNAGNATVATNDNWRNTQVGGLITADQSAEIAASGVAPGNDLESAIIANLAPGSYTAVVRGAGNSPGTGVVDAYDLSAASPLRLANIATRGLIQPGDKLMIAGFIVQNGPVNTVILAVGPSLTAFGINNALPDTTLQLKDQNGNTVIENDDWQSNQKQDLENTGLQPSDPREAAVIVTLPPGQYTAQVRGKPETTGIGVVQVYFLQ